MQTRKFDNSQHKTYGTPLIDFDSYKNEISKSSMCLILFEISYFAVFGTLFFQFTYQIDYDCTNLNFWNYVLSLFYLISAGVNIIIIAMIALYNVKNYSEKILKIYQYSNYTFKVICTLGQIFFLVIISINYFKNLSYLESTGICSNIELLTKIWLYLNYSCCGIFVLILLIVLICVCFAVKNTNK